MAADMKMYERISKLMCKINTDLVVLFRMGFIPTSQDICDIVAANEDLVASCEFDDLESFNGITATIDNDDDGNISTSTVDNWLNNTGISIFGYDDWYGQDYYRFCCPVGDTDMFFIAASGSKSKEEAMANVKAGLLAAIEEVRIMKAHQ